MNSPLDNPSKSASLLEMFSWSCWWSWCDDKGGGDGEFESRLSVSSMTVGGGGIEFDRLWRKSPRDRARRMYGDSPT